LNPEPGTDQFGLYKRADLRLTEVTNYFIPNTDAKKLRELSSAIPNLFATFGEKIAKLALDFAQATPWSL